VCLLLCVRVCAMHVCVLFQVCMCVLLCACVVRDHFLAIKIDFCLEMFVCANVALQMTAVQIVKILLLA